MKRQSPNRPPRSSIEWFPPDVNQLDLRFRVGDSILTEFVLGHDPAAILHELVQNEYDAGGSRLEVTFGETALEVTGNGAPVDRKGWHRLSVILGTGRVTDLDDEVEAKANGIGSKNFGLRSLFRFGDQIFIRSNGRQTVLDLTRGTPPAPIQDPASAGTRGIRIRVPYRTARTGRFEAFTSEAESAVFDSFAANISSTLLKLARPGTRKSLREVIVSSAREERRIVWKQSVEQLASQRRGFTLLARRTSMTDTGSSGRDVVEELEWQRGVELPRELRDAHIPGYFRERGGRIRIGLSLRTRRRRLHPGLSAGIVYYPIGVEHAYTGNQVSISAPFEMDSERSQIVDPLNSAFNAWLLDLAAEMTIELMAADWFERFGALAYRAVGAIAQSTLPRYSQAVRSKLETGECWPARGRPKSAKKKLVLTSADQLNMAASPWLDGFLSEHRCLHPALCDEPSVRTLAVDHGVRTFTVNSLICLRCAGENPSDLETELDDGESHYFYEDFPNAWKGLDRQERCADALETPRAKLSRENRRDLARSQTTLTAAGDLAAAENLWRVPNEIADACPVPPAQRLHPALSKYVAVRKRCKPFDSTTWICEVAERAAGGAATDEERVALYRYILSLRGRLPSKARSLVRKSPVLLDNKGRWVAPRSITLPNAPGARRLRLALHLPHKDYAKDRALAKALGFKNKITSDDVIRFAEIVANQPDLAEEFERVLTRYPTILTRRVVKQIRSIPFLRSNDGLPRAPEDLYLDTPKNRACVGPEGPFPAGNSRRLYTRLGYRARPDAERIIAYLEVLRLKGQPPSRPEVLYPELVAALEREGEDPNWLEDKEIIWTGQSYSAPADTLVGAKWAKVFVGVLPCVTGLSTPVKKAYLDLGAHVEPNQHHWTRLLASLGKSYSEQMRPLSEHQRQTIRRAYLHLHELPAFPPELPWLLDESGHLHTATDVESGQFLVDDDLELAEKLRKVEAPVFFADVADTRVIPFFDRLDVKSLTDVRRKVGQRIGDERIPPVWFRSDEYIRRMACPDFGDAMERMVAHDFKGSAGALERVHRAIERLRSLRRIVFIDELWLEYRVSGTTVTVPERAVWDGESVYLIWIRSRAELDGLLAFLVAKECMPSVEDQRRFSDGVYRLITCESSRDIQQYLQGKGIRWQPVGNGPESDEELEDHGDEELNELLRSSLLESIRLTRPGTPGSSESGGREEAVEEGHQDENGGDDVDVQLLPPLDEVNPIVIEPTPGWSPAAPSSQGGGSGGRWGPPTKRDQKRDEEIGRRGEEIVYRLERERVRGLGHPEDCVVWESESNPAADFDILSVDEDGGELFIEVKSTSGRDGRFHWSKPEFERALRERRRYILYRVYQAEERSPVVRAFRDPIALLSEGGLRLDIGTLRAEVEPSD